ncbi:hypothetical protein J5N97_029314 [Dioscorea zingiberensis]|uniref:Uncharacterized protein n=1 Tax=Dioscorea zingiberensis TaxID=325984 RepID=A0A9D5C039_9LILI|nr:hypothetical protein J5N97_029314 [Dioscorea zingiberensis]
MASFPADEAQVILRFDDTGMVAGNAGKMNSSACMIAMAVVMFFIVYKMTNFQHEHTEMESRVHPFDSLTEASTETIRIGYLPQGIIQSHSDMELKPLWFTKSKTVEKNEHAHRNLLAMAVGIKQKKNVDAIVNKFFSENFTVILFHYDRNVNEWHDLWWSDSVIHIVANAQTKWWFAKRFLYPDVVSIYDYIFLWDEDLGVDNFHPGRYLKIMESEGLDISQPALDPDLSEIHHKITIRRSKGNLHRRVSDSRTRRRCSGANDGPPCSGFVEGMAPVFSRSAWQCVWHLIQNDLIHGWGIDFKLGYCAQGNRNKRVGVIDSEYVVHQGIKTLGGSSTEQNTFLRRVQTSRSVTMKNLPQSERVGASKGRIQVRKQATLELQKFQERWNRAIKEDKDWVDPFQPRDSSKNHTLKNSTSSPCTQCHNA